MVREGLPQNGGAKQVKEWLGKVGARGLGLVERWEEVPSPPAVLCPGSSLEAAGGHTARRWAGGNQGCVIPKPVPSRSSAENSRYSGSRELGLVPNSSLTCCASLSHLSSELMPHL